MDLPSQRKRSGAISVVLSCGETPVRGPADTERGKGFVELSVSPGPGLSETTQVRSAGAAVEKNRAHDSVSDLNAGVHCYVRKAGSALDGGTLSGKQTPATKERTDIPYLRQGKNLDRKPEIMKKWN